MTRRDKPEKVDVVPKGLFVCLGFLIMSEVLALELVYTFGPYMVKSFHVVSKNHYGFLAGILGGAFGVTRLIGNPLWGCLSDKLGRRPVIVLGCIGNAATMVAFGFSKNITMAIILRAIQGGSSGNFAVVRAMYSDMAEAYSDDVMNKGWALFGLAWGLARASTGLLGGFLSQPCKRIRGFPDHGLFCKYPFLMPCLAGALFMMVTLVTVMYLLRETKVASAAIASGRSTRGDEEKQLDTHSGNSSLNIGTSGRTTKVWTTTTVVLVVINFLFWTMTAMFDDVFSIWTSATNGQGLDWSERDIGIYFGMLGAVIMINQTFVYPKIAPRFEPLTFFRWSAFWNAPTMFLFAVYKRGQSVGVGLLWALFTVGTFFSQVPRNGLGVTLGVIINQSVDPSVAGSLNGILEGVGAVAKIIGPIAGGALVAWDTTNGLPAPLDYHFHFLLMAILSLTIFALTIIFAHRLGKRSETRDDLRMTLMADRDDGYYDDQAVIK